MSSDVKIPEWAEKAAGTLALYYVDWIGRGKVDSDAEHVLTAVIALALLAAEQRGRKAGLEAKQHLEAAILSADPYRHIRAAIRSLGENK